jgi:hypothetical protein
MQFLSLTRQNRFAFTCPIFDAKVEMRSCVTLRDIVYRGQRIETRRGCQACIKSSKCPAAELVRRIAFNSIDATDHCGSVEEKHGRLPADVLERVLRVLVKDSDITQLNVVEGERDLIASSRARIEAQIATAPRERVSMRRVELPPSEPRASAEKPAERASVSPAPKTTPINKAAATGDLAAALNA